MSQVLSTCPLRTNSGCGKERRIFEEDQNALRPRRGRETAAGQRTYPRAMGEVILLTVQREIRQARSRHLIKAAAATRRECPRDGAHGEGDCHSDEGNGKRGSSGAERPSSRGTVETRTSTRSNHPGGAPSTFCPHLAREKTSTAMGGRGHYRTSQERRQYRLRKLPWHLAGATRG